MNYPYTHRFGMTEEYRKSFMGMIGRKRLMDFFRMDRCKVFVETGTHLGDGVAWAVESGIFEEIFSTELHGGAYARSSERFRNRRDVFLRNMDTVDFLREIVPTLQKDSLIYLDAHYSEHPYATCVKEYPVPLLLESKIILEGTADPSSLLVVIDDERGWGEELIRDLVQMYRSKGMVDCYLDDSIVFCRQEWIRNPRSGSEG